MIPRLKPPIGREEIQALFSFNPDLIEKLERNFSKTFSTRCAAAFPYGRSALWAFFQAMGIKHAEIIQPAYTCSVVGHATVLSGNIPRFVDINLTDYNMDLELFAEAINERTRAVIPTHIFGYPMNVEKVQEIVRDAENRYGHKIYVVQDCAHSFEAEWKGRSVINYGDAALFGLGISKQITSIFGGVMTTNDPEIAEMLSAWRDTHFREKSWLEKWKRRFYLLASAAAFTGFTYGFTYWLQKNTPLLKRLTDAYHLDEAIHFPPDFDHNLSAPEAAVGIEQLNKYKDFKKKRREIARNYFENLSPPKDWVMPPAVEGATYSHFVIRVPDREQVLKSAAERGVQFGQLIEYSMPHLPAYREYAKGGNFPNSLLASRTTINLPLYPSLTAQDQKKILAQTQKFDKM